MKSLVVYYSRTGTTKKVAEAISSGLGSEIEAIQESAGSRKGILGYLRSGRRAMKGRDVPIKEPRVDASLCDVVIVGTPVWAGAPSSPVASYLRKNCGRLPRVAFFCTAGGSRAEKVIGRLEEVAGKKGVASLVVRTQAARAGAPGPDVQAFIRAIRQAVGS